MREIKFRCWDKDEEVMFKQADIGSIDFSYKQINIENDQYSYLESYDKDGSFKLMQYTGLKDKNGVEIYEGDIAKESRKRVKNQRHFVVVWNNDIGSYTFKPLDKTETSYPCFNIGTIKSLEVIGNIYENPELLKGSEE